MALDRRPSTMNPSQLIAWLTCLALACFAAIIALINSYSVKLLERRFEEVKAVAANQGAVLEDIRELLRSIQQDLAGRQQLPGNPSGSG